MRARGARARKPSKSAIPDHNPSWRSRPQPAKSAETGVTPLDDRARLLLTDLEPLAVFLCGPRWQSALARRINRSPRLVRRWVAGDRPISVAASQRIIALVRDKHAQQMAQARTVYLGMVGGLNPPISARLMAIDLDQLAVRRPATAQLGGRVSIVDPPCAVHRATTARAARPGDHQSAGLERLEGRGRLGRLSEPRGAISVARLSEKNGKRPPPAILVVLIERVHHRLP